MAVRAKFYCDAVTKRTWGSEVVLRVVNRGEDNKKWSSASPAGELKISIRNELAAEQFEPGEEYFVDFTPAPKGVEGMDDETS